MFPARNDVSIDVNIPERLSRTVECRIGKPDEHTCGDIRHCQCDAKDYFHLSALIPKDVNSKSDISYGWKIVEEFNVSVSVDNGQQRVYGVLA